VTGITSVTDVEYEALIPMLNVRDIQASLDFYQNELGFQRVSSDRQLSDWRWARVACGSCDFMLMQTNAELRLPRGCNAKINTGWPAQLYFLLDDVEALHRRLSARGCEVSALRQSEHGLMEFSMQDPDGHMLGFGPDLLDENDELGKG